MSMFAEFEPDLSAMVDAVFGDPVTLYPRRTGEVSSSVDTDRPKVTVVGVVDFAPLAVLPKGKEQYDAFQPNLAAEKIHVSFDENVFGQRSNRPRTGDLLVAVIKSGTFTFRVVSIEPDELGRFVCPCKLVGEGVRV